jgi:hypothetical protein
MVAVSSWAVKWQGMAHSLPQTGPSLVEMVFPKPGQLAMVNQ